MNEKEIKLNDKTLILRTPPATVGYALAMEYKQAVGNKNDADFNKIVPCLLKQLKYCQIKLQDGRCVELDNEEFINQHLTIKDLLELQSILLEFNFGFLTEGDRSDS